LQRIQTSLPGVWQIQPQVFHDERGFFSETYHQLKFSQFGITDSFVQDNHSYSRKNTLRGLHYQLRHPQTKLCYVVEGQALDVVVDVRLGSPHFGKWTSMLLSAEEGNQIYIPPGFAHGFFALTERVHFLYKCSHFYDAADEYGILWNDPDLHISWSTLNPLLSKKDAELPTLAMAPRKFLPKYTDR
jgi:dTDP-4-dehydrorhamnose 3,5-epimerase